MNADLILTHFDELAVWKKGDQRGAQAVTEPVRAGPAADLEVAHAIWGGNALSERSSTVFRERSRLMGLESLSGYGENGDNIARIAKVRFMPPVSPGGDDLIYEHSSMRRPALNFKSVGLSRRWVAGRASAYQTP